MPDARRVLVINLTSSSWLVDETKVKDTLGLGGKVLGSLPIVSLSEDQAWEKGYEPVTGTYRFAALGKALAMGEDVDYVQLVADKDSDLLLGASMMGPHVTDVIHEVAVALQNGLTVWQLGTAIHARPTIAEAVMEAAHDVHSESVHVSS